jgi:hypothetical protein
VKLPGFCAEVSLYATRNRYTGGVDSSSAGAGVVPALPGCGACNSAYDRCFDCLDRGIKFSKCSPCKLLSHCSGACDGAQGGLPDYGQSLLDFADCERLCGGDEDCTDMFC